MDQNQREKDDLVKYRIRMCEIKQRKSEKSMNGMRWVRQNKRNCKYDGLSMKKKN